MKKFLLTIGGFALVILLSKAAQLTLLYALAPESDRELAYYGQKEQLPKPRIIIVGASNVTFNYDYERLVKSFPSYQIVGCHYSAPSGLFIVINKLYSLKPTKEDIVIMDLPHMFYESSYYLPIDKLHTIKRISKRGLENTFKFNWLYASRSLFRFNFKDTYYVLKELTKNNKSAKEITFSFPKRDSLYNSCWTNTDDIRVRLKEGDENKEKNFKVSSTGFDKDYIDNMYLSLKQNIPSTIVFHFPPLKKEDYVLNPKKIEHLEKEFPFINTFQSSVYEERFMFDGWYHLNKCGQQINTSKFENELLVLFNKKQNSVAQVIP